MVARALSETAGKTWSRTSPRAGEDLEGAGAFAEGNVSVRRAAGAGVATGALDTCSAGGFTVVAFAEGCAAGFEGRGASLRGGCVTDLGSEAGCEAAEVVEEEEFGRWLR